MPSPPPQPWKAPTPAEVAELKKRFTGLDDNLHYQEGHTIHKDYTAYKAAQKPSDGAVTTYKDKAKTLPPPNDRTPKVGGKRFTKEGHQTLAPLAGTVSQASQE